MLLHGFHTRVGRLAFSKLAKGTITAEQAISEVLDHVEEYREELGALMVDEFHIIEKEEIPVQYKEVA